MIKVHLGKRWARLELHERERKVTYSLERLSGFSQAREKNLAFAIESHQATHGTKLLPPREAVSQCAVHLSIHANLPWPLFFKEGYCYGTVRN